MEEGYSSYVLNAFFAFLLLLLLSPLFLVIAVLLFINSPGSVLFRQLRLGEAAVPFVLYKFRTMSARIADGEDDILWTQKDDPRIFFIGKILRRSRLDELPQLVNVLKGEMNIVGCRPITPALNAILTDKIDEFRIRYRYKPGITGWAQLKFGYAATLEEEIEKFDYDKYYILNKSFKLDLRILLMTIKVPFQYLGQ